MEAFMHKQACRQAHRMTETGWYRHIEKDREEHRAEGIRQRQAHTQPHKGWQGHTLTGERAHTIPGERKAHWTACPIWPCWDVRIIYRHWNRSTCRVSPGGAVLTFLSTSGGICEWHNEAWIYNNATMISLKILLLYNSFFFFLLELDHYVRSNEPLC